MSELYIDIFDIYSCYPDVSRFKKTDLRRPSKHLWRTRRQNLLKFYSCSSWYPQSHHLSWGCDWKYRRRSRCLCMRRKFLNFSCKEKKTRYCSNNDINKKELANRKSIINYDGPLIKEKIFGTREKLDCVINLCDLYWEI